MCVNPMLQVLPVLVLFVGVLSPNVRAAGDTSPMLMPRIVGDWWRVAGDPDRAN